MAIAKTRNLRHVIVNPAVNPLADDDHNDGNPSLGVGYVDVFDDPDDDDLPQSFDRQVVFYRYDSEGNATNVENEDPLVVSIAAAIWS